MTAPQLAADYTYTDQNLVDLLRQCLAKITIQGQMYQMVIPGGGTRTFTNADLVEVSNLIAFYERRVDAANGVNQGMPQNLVQFRRAR